MPARFQMDCFGNIRIVVDGSEGRPAQYNSIARVESGGDTYIGVSEYFGDIPSERVFKLVPVDSVAEDAPVCNLFRPDEPCFHKP